MKDCLHTHTHQTHTESLLQFNFWYPASVFGMWWWWWRRRHSSQRQSEVFHSFSFIRTCQLSPQRLALQSTQICSHTKRKRANRIKFVFNFIKIVWYLLNLHCYHTTEDNVRLMVGEMDCIRRHLLYWTFCTHIVIIGASKKWFVEKWRKR